MPMEDLDDIEIPEELLMEIVSNADVEEAISSSPEINDMMEEEIKPPTVRSPVQKYTLPAESIPAADTFTKQEHLLYQNALDVYEDALSSGDEKMRLSAAKDIINLHGKNKELQAKKDVNEGKGNTYTQINISVEAVQKALKDALYGMQGGYKVTDQGEGNGREEEDSLPDIIIPVEGADEE